MYLLLPLCFARAEMSSLHYRHDPVIVPGGRAAGLQDCAGLDFDTGVSR